MKKQKCNICDYEWKSRADPPKQCPKCKRYDYNKKRKVFAYGTATERPVLGKDKKGLILGKEKRLRKV